MCRLSVETEISAACKAKKDNAQTRKRLAQLIPIVLMLTPIRMGEKTGRFRFLSNVQSLV